MRAPLICYYIPLFLILNCYSTTAQPYYYYGFDAPTANLSTTWTNTGSLLFSANFTDGTRFRSILIRGTDTTRFACGFYCNGACTSYIFSVFIVQTDRWSRDTPQTIVSSQVVWSANRDYPVSDGAVLNFTATGELVLQDVDGSTVWSSNTRGKSVAGLNLTDDGNLVLFDNNRFMVWQSFDYPTDCLLPGQRLLQGQQLIPSVSSTNWTAQKGLFSLQVRDDGLFAYVGSNPPIAYYAHTSTSWQILGNNTNKGRGYVRFLNGSLSLFIRSVEPSDPDKTIPIPQASSAQYMKLMPDGHLKVFELQGMSWSMVADLLTTDYLEECDYPMACGRNGLCTGNQQCICPDLLNDDLEEYFRAVDDMQPDQGCTEITPLTCNATQDQTFIALENVTYFNVILGMEMVDVEENMQF